MKNQKGQAVVETALVIPILLILLCMIIDTGRIVYFESRLNSICQESVRIAGLGGKDMDVQNYALSQLGSGYSSPPQVNTSPNEYTRKSGSLVTVTISADINYITPFANVILHSPFNATAHSTIRVE